MIDSLRIPEDAQKLESYSDLSEFRSKGRSNELFWVGQSDVVETEINSFDHSDCYHIISQDDDEIMGYARLKPIRSDNCHDQVARQIYELSSTTGRHPAFELQRANWVENTNCYPLQSTKASPLRELLLEVFKLCNMNHARFLFTSCDKGGLEEIRRLGLRYSTISAPFLIENRVMLILCIAATNSNFSSLQPLQVVGGTNHQKRASVSPTSPRESVNAPNIFDQLETLGSIVANPEVIDSE